jgi:hypothetical protein
MTMETTTTTMTSPAPASPTQQPAAQPAAQTQPSTPTVTPETDDGWRKKVYMANAFSDEESDFLDLHWKKGRLSRMGQLQLSKPIGTFVPYVFLPSHVKKYIGKINESGDLLRSSFKNKRAYESAMHGLYVYGYLENIDQAIIEKTKALKDYVKKWRGDPVNKTKMQATMKRAQKYRAKRRSEHIAARIITAT